MSAKEELERKKARLAAIRQERAKAQPKKATENFDDILKGLDLNINHDPTAFKISNIQNKENVTKKKVLKISPVITANVISSERVTYTKETQTKKEEEMVDLQPEMNVMDCEPLESSVLHGMSVFNSSAFDWEMNFDMESIGNCSPGFAKGKKSLGPIHEEQNMSLLFKTLSNEDKNIALNAPELKIFVSRCEKLFDEEFNKTKIIWRDYAGGEEIKAPVDGQLITKATTFANKTTQGRKITSISMASSSNDFSIVSYSDSRLAPVGEYSNGLVFIWDLNYSNSEPFKKLHFGSTIRSTTTSPFHNNLIFGGSYNGEIVVWDLRSKTPLPVMKTPLTSEGHHLSVFGLFLSQCAKNGQITSIATDSKICKWSLDMLNKPLDTIEVLTNDVDVKQNYTSLCADEVRKNGQETGIFLIGDNGGDIREVDTNISGGDKKKIKSSHYGPVTSLSFQPTSNSKYYLTSSFDFSAKLWAKDSEKELNSFSDLKLEPLSQVQWSPTQKDFFAIANCNNTITFWDLGNNPEYYGEEHQLLSVPVDQVDLDTNVGISCIRFNSSGSILTVGDNKGTLHAFQLNRQP